MSAREYYAYRLQVRRRYDGTADDALYRWGRLFQEYVCMALAKIELDRLRWIEYNQQAIRADLYQNLADAVAAQGNPADVVAGRRVVLPSSFAGGPRDMNQRYFDAMACCQKIAYPSLFLTMTANPYWDEVVSACNGDDPPRTQQSPADRPDIIARVFRLKLQALCKELYKDGIFGVAVAHLHVIEFQKRGLPHAHILIILCEADRLEHDVHHSPSPLLSTAHSPLCAPHSPLRTPPVLAPTLHSPLPTP